MLLRGNWWVFDGVHRGVMAQGGEGGHTGPCGGIGLGFLGDTPGLPRGNAVQVHPTTIGDDAADLKPYRPRALRLSQQLVSRLASFEPVGSWG